MGKTIALVGGGTMGPTAPLLALQKKIAATHPEFDFVWVGTPQGPERSVVEALGVRFIPLHVAKFPRYPSRQWLTWPWDFRRASQEARKILDECQPCIVIGAGGFSQVPMIRQAAQRKIPCAIHQLDFVPLLSNKLVAKYCQLITTSFVYHHRKLLMPIYWKSLDKQAAEERAIATPNRFVSMRAIEKAQAAQSLGLDPNRPIVLFMGGGTGSQILNGVVEHHLEDWLESTQIIQLTGKGRAFAAKEGPGYVKREFMDEEGMLCVFSAADVVVSRAGMGSIADLATFSKASILVPIRGSTQSQNARRLPLAVIEVEEGPQLLEDLKRQVKRLLADPNERRHLGYELNRAIRTDDGGEWMEMILRLIKA